MKTCQLVVLFVVLLNCTLWSQKNVKEKIRVADSSIVQIITTTDGSTLNGKIVEINGDEIRFESNVGTITIPITKIKDIKEISNASRRNGEYWFPNPHATRLYLAPTGFALKQGEGYFQSTYIFFAGVAYGITDNISFSGGASLFPGASEQFFYFAPKLSFETAPNVHLATGMTYMGLTGGSSESIQSFYAVGSIGSRDNNVSLAINQGFGESSQETMLILGYQGRMSRRVSFVSENWLSPESGDGVISLGMRFFNESIAADLGFWRILKQDMGGFPLIPYVDFVVMF